MGFASRGFYKTHNPYPSKPIPAATGMGAGCSEKPQGSPSRSLVRPLTDQAKQVIYVIKVQKSRPASYTICVFDNVASFSPKGKNTIKGSFMKAHTLQDILQSKDVTFIQSYSSQFNVAADFAVRHDSSYTIVTNLIKFVYFTLFSLVPTYVKIAVTVMQYFTNHITHVSDRVGPGQPRVRSGRAKSETLALDPMRAGPGHKNTGPWTVY